MFSVKNAGLQFMFRVGQLRKEYNLLWEHEYIGYHGLRSIDDIHLMTLEGISKKRLTSNELSHCTRIISNLSKLMENPVSFYLLSMIILLDTSNLKKEYQLVLDDNDCRKNQSNHCNHDETFCKTFTSNSFSNCVPSISNVFIGNDDIATEPDETHKDQTIGISNDHKKKAFEERFKGIKSLQRHYIILLHNHWKQADDKMKQSLGDNEVVLNKVIESIKQMAHYAGFLMK